MESIYLDNNATTPIDPQVLATVVETLQQVYGNPSSAHTIGKKAKAVITNARHTIADYFNVRPDEIIFTSGATEGINLLLKGLFDGNWNGHLITTDVEHSSVYNCATYLEKLGCEVSYLQVGSYGATTAEAVEEAIRPDTRVIAIMAVNNETGVVTDIAAIASVAEKHNIPFIVDGVAWIGKAEIALPRGVSALCFSGHKIHAPKGVGVAYINKKLKVAPQMLGGEHEYGMRAGTENVSGIAAIAQAIKILEAKLPESIKHMQSLRDTFEKQLFDNLQGLSINGQGPRICNCSNIAFDSIDGEALLAQLDMHNIACSHGSACSSGALEPSRVLLNMGIPPSLARASIRFSLSRMTTEVEVLQAASTIIELVNKQYSLTSK